MKITAIATAAFTLFSAGLATAQTTTPAPTAPMRAASADRTAPGAAPMAPRTEARRDSGASRGAEKDALEQALKSVEKRSDYVGAIEKAGYKISAINADKKDYLEYEIVKGDHSYEVQLDFDDGAAKATKIDVTNNMWRADSTKALLKDPNYKSTSPMVADKEGKHSDRRYMKGWNDEKAKLETALAPNMKASEYKSKLEQMGYKITAVNDRDADYLEYEIVKGENSYEVQIDMDPKTKVAKKVDVTSNVWEADSTEAAKKK